jgi:hypothetical protein
MRSSDLIYVQPLGVLSARHRSETRRSASGLGSRHDHTRARPGRRHPGRPLVPGGAPGGGDGGAGREGAEELFAGRPGLFVGVISSDLGPELPEILAALRPGLQENVCFDSITLEPAVPGQDLAMRTLEGLGFSQDFVFTVDLLEGAVDHAIDTLLAPEHGGWDGRFAVVLGPREVIDRARRHLTEPA